MRNPWLDSRLQASHAYLMIQPQGNTPQPIMFWVIWFAILTGLLIMQFFAGGGIPSGSDQGDGPVLFQTLSLVSATASIIVRFVIIPKLRDLQKKLPMMIVGLALAESIGILGMFAVPHQYGATRLFMLGLSIACVVISAPVYAKFAGGGSPFRS
jgi:hypothetical protein